MTDIVKRLVALANSLGGTEEDDIMAGVAEIKHLRAALQFYASEETYGSHGMQDAEIFHDGGLQARRALEQKP